MKKKLINFYSILTAVFLLLTVSGCKVPGDPQNPGVPVLTFNDVLSSLGIYEEPVNRKDPNGNNLAEDYNPLGTELTTLFSKKEIYTAGFQASSVDTDLVRLFDDSLTNFNPLISNQNATWASGNAAEPGNYEINPKDSISADVDNDGRDEIINIYYRSSDMTLHMKVINTDGVTSNTSSYQIPVPGELSIPDLFSANATQNGFSWNGHDAVAGNLDNDPEEELIITFGTSYIILDDANHNFNIKNYDTFAPLDTYIDAYCYIRTCVADFDIDGRDEIVFVNTTTQSQGSNDFPGEIYIYDDLWEDQFMAVPLLDRKLVSYTVSFNGSGVGTTNCQLTRINCSTGDVDKDGLPEVVLIGNLINFLGVNDLAGIFILDTEMDNNSNPQFEFYTAAESVYRAMLLSQKLAFDIECGDINGDGKDEIVCANSVFSLNSAGSDISNDYSLNYSILVSEDRFHLIEVGDVDGDFLDEVIVLAYFKIPSLQAGLFSFGLDTDTATLIMEESIHYPENVNQSPIINYALTLPDVDQDGAIVKYAGHDVRYGNPQIITVIASPPYFEGIQDLNGSGTEFGKSEGSEIGEETSFGFNVDVSLGLSYEAPVLGRTLASAEIKTTISNNFNWGTASLQEYSETWGYIVPAGTDSVIFTCVPFDVYYYEIIAFQGETDAGTSFTLTPGEIVTVNIPRQPREYCKSIEDYNANNGDFFDIDNTILLHTKGQPFTYNSSSSMASIKAQSNNRGLFSTSYRTAGSGGNTFIQIDDLSSELSTYNYDLDVIVEAEAVLGGVLIGGGAGFQYGYNSTVATKEGTHIRGEIGRIPTGNNLEFTWGLMMYPYLHNKTGQAFNIVTYWVDE